MPVRTTTSHNRTALPSDAATSLPSGLNATHLAQVASPSYVNARNNPPSDTRHNRTILSPDPEATRVPSELKATHWTALV